MKLRSFSRAHKLLGQPWVDLPTAHGLGLDWLLSGRMIGSLLGCGFLDGEGAGFDALATRAWRALIVVGVGLAIASLTATAQRA